MSAQLACTIGLTAIGLFAFLGTMFAAVGSTFRRNQRR